MLINFKEGPADMREGLLEELNRSDFKFFLTGSRFFSTISSVGADYDFYAESNESIATFLQNLDFKYTIGNYDDINMIAIYRHPCRIDIQLVKSTRIKEIAQSILVEWASLRNFDKKDQRTIWNLALIAATKIVEIQKAITLLSYGEQSDIR